MNVPSHQIQALERALQHLKKHMTSLYVDHTLSKADLNILFCLRFCKGEKMMKMSDIAKTLKVTLPAITHRVHHLIEEGYIEKKQDPKDLRVTYLVLKEKTIHWIDSIKDDYFRHVTQMIYQLGKDDTEELIRILNRLT